MAARQTRLILFLSLWVALDGGLRASRGLEASSGTPQAKDGSGGKPLARIVSLVPSVTETLFAIGAGSKVAGVSNYDSFPDEVRKLPRVGALLDPDTERIFALRPDMVVVYGSQTELKARFDRAGIRTYVVRHSGIEGVFATITELGAITGQTAQAASLARDLRARIQSVRSKVAGRPKPRTLLVFERQPNTLRGLYVSGGVGFMHEMLEAAGGTNVFADVARESVQPSHETLIARAPDVILEVRAVGLLEPRDLETDRRAWSALASVPAVRNGRISFLVGEYLVVPGPRVAQGIDAIARALHPESYK